jgi:hypothetical protein
VHNVAGSNQGGRGSSDEGRRPTKAERREEARLQREEIQRKMASRRRNRTIGLVLVVLAVIIAVVAVFMTSGGDGTSANGIPSADSLLARAAAATDTAGCDTVQETSDYDDPPGDQAHIGSAPEVTSPPDLSTYPSIPPASGPHDATPLPAGIYESPPDVYPTMHTLEHGGAIVWYSPDADAAKVADLKAFYEQRPSEVNIAQDRVIVAPYDYPEQGDAGQLPAGVQMALVSWHRLLTCSSVSLPVAFDFTSQYAFPVYDGRTYKGVAPEPGAAM